MLAFIFSTGTKLLSNMTNDGNVLFSQVPTKMRHTNLMLKGVTLATKQEKACMSRRQRTVFRCFKFPSIFSQHHTQLNHLSNSMCFA